MRLATLTFVSIVGVLAAGAPAAQAATITVAGACTLVSAITAANADAPSGGCTGGAIAGTFTPGGADTIVLTADITFTTANLGVTATPGVQSDITIAGNGHTIQRDLSLACPSGNALTDFRLFTVFAQGALTLNDVTLKNGCPNPGVDSGGAVLVIGGQLAINRSTIRDHRGSFGGAIVLINNPPATFPPTAIIVDSALLGNISGSTAGAIRSKNYELTIINSTLTDNSADAGSAVETDGGKTFISSSTIARNINDNALGDALIVFGSGSLHLHNTILDNTSDQGGNCSVAGGSTLVSQGHNLSTDFSCNLTGPSDFLNTPSGLGTFIDSALPGKAHILLLASSFAIDSGEGCPQTDQLGHARLGICDRGAIEFGLLTTQTLTAVKDSTLRADSVNTNEGANRRLHLRVPGKRRVVVGFDLSDVNLAAVVRARLVLTILANSNDWNGVNNFVDAHPLLTDFVEGNGAVVGEPAPNPGNGSGTTWKCPTDTNIANTVRNCATVWNGGLFDLATAPGVVHTNGLLGDVEWDVTADVVAGQELWLIKKRKEGALQPGGVRYYSREGSLAAFGDLSRAPRLILELQ